MVGTYFVLGTFLLYPDSSIRDYAKGMYKSTQFWEVERRKEMAARMN